MSTSLNAVEYNRMQAGRPRSGGEGDPLASAFLFFAGMSPAILKYRRDQRIAGVPPALCRKANKKAVEMSTSLISGCVQPLAGETPAIRRRRRSFSVCIPFFCRRFACDLSDNFL
jgi:hypothetical protein